MKIINWRRKLAASLVAGGLLSPTAMAANLDQNLVLNPGFENVSTALLGDYGAPNILDWQGGPAFAYSHNGTNGVPDYADGDTGAPGGGFNLDTWIRERGLSVEGPEPWKDGARRWIFPVCPFNAAHTDRSAYLIEFSSGALAAGCHHNGCNGKRWQDIV